MLFLIMFGGIFFSHSLYHIRLLLEMVFFGKKSGVIRCVVVVSLYARFGLGVTWWCLGFHSYP